MAEPLGAMEAMIRSQVDRLLHDDSFVVDSVDVSIDTVQGYCAWGPPPVTDTGFRTIVIRGHHRDWGK